MEPLSPRSTNIRVRPQPSQTLRKDQLVAQAAAQRRVQRQKDHPEPPPSLIYEPDLPHGERGERGERYTVGEFLGKGGFAICFEGELHDRSDRLSGHKYALKIVKSIMPQAKMTEKFRTELQIHSKMHHPSIVDFHRAFTFETSTYVVLGLCQNGSMMDMVRKRKYLTEPEVRRYVIQTAGAIKYMHHKNVIHRDLKMGNIFLDGDMNVKIGDFGLAALLVSDKEYSANRRRTLCGTPNYIAPEVLEKGQKGHDYKVDIWSLGIIIFAMLTGIPPFQSKTQEEIYRKVKAREYDWPSIEKCPNFISQNAQDLVASMLVLAEERPEPDDIVSHDFFKQGVVPGPIPASARHTQPTFTTWSPALGGTEESFYLGRWMKICRECGVGNKNGKEQNALVGEELHMTTYQECRLEERAGRTPIVPIPANSVYRPFPDSKNWPHAHVEEGLDLLKLGRTKDNLHGLPTSQSYPTIQNASARQSRNVSRGTLIDTINTDAKLVLGPAEARPRPTTKSHAATLREQIRPTRSTSAEQLGQGSSIRPAMKTVEESNPIVRDALHHEDILEPATARSIRTTRSSTNQGRLPQSSSTGTLRGTAPRRVGLPKYSSSRTLKSAVSPVIEEKEATKPGAEDKIRTRAQATGTGVIVERIAELHEAMSKVSVVDSTTAAREVRSTRLRNQRPETLARPPASKATSSVAPIVTNSLARAPATNAYIAPPKSFGSVSSSSSAALMSAINTSIINIDIALGNTPGLGLHRSAKSSTALPIVLKWIDYTTKYGIGYILNDGSVGCLFSATSADSSATCSATPSTTCVVVRDGELHAKSRHLSTYSDRQQIVPINSSRPIEFIEGRGDTLRTSRVPSSIYTVPSPEEGNIVERFLIPSTLSANDPDDQRKRRMLVTWRKFANYMSDPLPSSTTYHPAPPPLTSLGQADKVAPFVRFYQRFYDTGVWYFSTSDMQFNFPDHTKIVLSPNATHADFYYLPVALARDLRSTGGLLPGNACLDERGLLSGELREMLEGKCGAEIVEANGLREKVEFIRAVLKDWAVGGGLGRYAREDQRCREWSGVKAKKTEEKDTARGCARVEKRVWVTVGATGVGGDWRVEQRSIPPSS